MLLKLLFHFAQSLRSSCLWEGEVVSGSAADTAPHSSMLGQLHAGTAPGATIPAAACAEFLKCFRIGYWVFKAGKGEEEQVDADCSACTGGSDCGEPPRSSSLPHPAGTFLFHLAPAKKTQGWTKRNVAESIMSPLIQQAK